MKLVIVESPTKVKTIGKYLGEEYKILASFGHVRDLPSKNGSVDTEHNFNMLYKIKEGSEKHVSAIVSAAKKSSLVLLATDPDREGESIAWNVAEILKESKAINPSLIKRISFTEITPSAVKNAIANPRNIDANLVDAQQARLSLDYLVGFNLSPVLWRKLPGSKSAGRVQSVALRLIAEREKEIKKFEPKEYWTVDVSFDSKKTKGGKREDVTSLAKVIEHAGKKLDKEYPTSQKDAKQIEEDLNKAKEFIVSNLTEKLFKQNPYPPFITSTLQQAAFQAYSFTSKRTMQIAQRLYEGVEIGNTTMGLITYMRTDGLNLSAEAIGSIRGHIKSKFGSDFLPEKSPVYKTKVKNAQEAHEAIRPADITITPEIASKYLPADELKLYSMIWRRTVACQMVPAIKSTKTIEFKVEATKTTAVMSQTVVKFTGFLEVYKGAAKSDSEEENQNEQGQNFSLPNFQKEQSVPITEVFTAQHFTSPPPRFNEASLIKKMEELGIGRPSTYSTIVNVIQDRGYVELTNKQFHASMRGMLVTSFLKHFATKYVEYDFTALLEQQLDDVSSGESTKLKVLNNFWKPFSECMRNSGAIDYQEVSEALTNDLGEYLFHKKEDGSIDNTCTHCHKGKMLVHVGRFGPYMRCSRYPDCNGTIKLSQQEDGYAMDDASADPSLDISVVHQGKTMRLRKGPYGHYVEVTNGTEKYNRTIPKEETNITEEKIILYGSLPRLVGQHPDGGEILASIGKFGPYVSHNKVYASIRLPQLNTITPEEALVLLNKKAEKSKKPWGKKETPEPNNDSTKATKSTKATAKTKTVVAKKRQTATKQRKKA